MERQHVPPHLGAQCSDKILMHINRSPYWNSFDQSRLVFSGNVAGPATSSKLLNIASMTSTRVYILMSLSYLKMEKG